jgi:two-component system, OmpR family, response regulator ResD
MKVLVVDDEIKIREVIIEYLKINNYDHDQANDGLEALQKLEKDKFDLIILDIMMPKLDGYSVAKKIKEKINIPIIMLTARVEEYDKLRGFEIGIDDYVTKPFSPRELIARINVALNRNKKHKIFCYNDLFVDVTSRKVKIKDEEIKLSPKEYELLFYLIENKNIALSREKILSSVWGYDFFGEDRTVDTHIKTLRNNLSEEYRDLIITVRGMGYKFEIKD